MDNHGFLQSNAKGPGMDSDVIWHKPYATIPVTEEMMTDVRAYRDMWDRVADEAFERQKDLLDSPRLGPTRTDLNRILSDRHFDERGQRLAAELSGKPAGPVRR